MNPTQETYSELQSAYDHFNRALFGGQLPPCLITLQREKKCVAGYFSPARFIRYDKSRATDEIAMNPMQFMTMPLLENLQTMAHEMVHQWQHHFGADKSIRSYHNHEWGRKMREIGLEPSSTGKPGGDATGQKMAEYVIAGGRFEKAADDLMTREFVLSWADRTGILPDAIADLPADVAELVAVAGGKNQTPAGSAGVMSAGKSGVRVKYYCPQCGVNVWGRSELNIVCGSCGVGFNQR